MTVLQAKRIVATRLNYLNVPVELINAAVDMTRDESILEAAEAIEVSNVNLEELEQLIYFPQM